MEGHPGLGWIYNVPVNIENKTSTSEQSRGSTTQV